jgi:hypothetical protein
MPSSLSAAVERARERFRRDVAEQMQLAAARAGVAGSVTLNGERVVLELGTAGPDGAPLQVIALFNEDAGPGASEQVSLHVETGDDRRTLLTVAWWDDPAMLGTAYGVEAKTNQIAVASFLGGGGASWLYGLVGPVLIGGLAALSKSRLGKGAAYGLLMSWALAMASITASDKGYLDRAQGYFPKEASVLALEQAVGAARVRKDAANAELKRLGAPAKGTSELLAEAKKRWQAAEIEWAAKREAELREKVRARAGKAAIEAGVALSEDELRLRDALLNDPSRAWAWRVLFAIFAVINLAGPLAIARVLEQWRADHIEARASARDGHKKKAAAALLRGSRSAQQAHAMLLLRALIEELKRGGAAPELIAELDLVEVGRKAAERFDRGVNARRATRGLFGSRSQAGPS